MIELKLNGKTYTGWKSAAVNRAINVFASSFELTVSPKFTDGGVDIPLDAACDVYVDGTPVIRGYVDEVSPSYTRDSHEITFGGRSRTADLVDCSAILATGQMMRSDVASIIRKLLEPYGLRLIYNAASSFSVPDFQLQQGETVSAAIERLCAAHALVFQDNALGDLVISQVAMDTAAAALIHKVGNGHNNNVLEGACVYSRRDRFSEYVIKSQTGGSDEAGGTTITGVVGKALDSEIPRYRPLILMPENNLAASGAKARAAWEKNTRAGKSVELEYKVQGWKNNFGQLWTPNAYVTVDDDFIQIKGKLIISEVTFEIDDSSGTTTSLRIVPPEAFLAPAKTDTAKATGNGKTYSGWPELKDGV